MATFRPIRSRLVWPLVGIIVLTASKNSNGQGWDPFQNAGGQLIDGPGIALTSTGLTIYVEGLDQGLYETRITPGGSAPTGTFTGDGGILKYGAGATGLHQAGL